MFGWHVVPEKKQTEKELKEERVELKKKITLKQDRLKVLGKKTPLFKKKKVK